MELGTAVEILVAVSGLLAAALSFLETRRGHHGRRDDDHVGTHGDGSASERGATDGDVPRGEHGQHPNGPQG
jgi:hypothetical protein